MTVGRYRIKLGCNHWSEIMTAEDAKATITGRLTPCQKCQAQVTVTTEFRRLSDKAPTPQETRRGRTRDARTRTRHHGGPEPI